MEWPASAKRGGASLSTRRAIAAMLSSRVWLATITGPNRHSAGMTGAQIRAEEANPGTSRIGVVWSIIASQAPEFAGNYAAELRGPRRPVKYAKTHVNRRISALTPAPAGTMNRAHDTT